jgi:hypothetical protein
MTSQQKKIKRVLRWYEKSGDALIGECELHGVTLGVLQELFGQAAENPMFYAYSVSNKQAEYLQKYCSKHQIDLNAYDYFVQSYSTE